MTGANVIDLMSPEQVSEQLATQARTIRVQREELDELRQFRLDHRVPPQDETEASALQLLTLDEFVQRPIISTHVAGIIPAKSFIVAFGPTKQGKTFVIGDMLMHGAHGLDWNCFKIPRRLRIAYLIGEGATGFKVRLHAWRAHHDSIETPGEFRILPRGMSLPHHKDELIAVLKEFAPDVVVTDTLNRYFGAGDENSTQDMTVFCTAVNAVIDQVGCSLIAIHHTGHGDSGRERGSIVLRSACDVVIQIGKDTSGNGLIGFQVITGRDVEPMDEPLSLRLVPVETDWLDEDGIPMTTCLVESAGQPVNLPGNNVRPLGPGQSTLYEVIKAEALKHHKDANGDVLLTRMDIAALAKDRGLSKQTISSAWEPLAKRKYIRLLEPGSLLVRV